MVGVSIMAWARDNDDDKKKKNRNSEETIIHTTIMKIDVHVGVFLVWGSCSHCVLGNGQEREIDFGLAETGHLLLLKESVVKRRIRRRYSATSEGLG